MQGKYEEAAAAFERVGAAEQVMAMWTDLRQFDKASQWAERVGQGSASVDALRAQQALWSEEVKDFRRAFGLRTASVFFMECSCSSCRCYTRSTRASCTPVPFECRTREHESRIYMRAGLQLKCTWLVESTSEL